MSRKPLSLLITPGVLALLVFGRLSAWAHPLDPALLEVWETPDGAVQVRWRQPRAQPANAPLTPVLPEACRQVSTPSVSQSDTHVTQR